jgi:hypothetical protein
LQNESFVPYLTLFYAMRTILITYGWCFLLHKILHVVLMHCNAKCPESQIILPVRACSTIVREMDCMAKVPGSWLGCNINKCCITTTRIFSILTTILPHASFHATGFAQWLLFNYFLPTISVKHTKMCPIFHL